MIKNPGYHSYGLVNTNADANDAKEAAKSCWSFLAELWENETFKQVRSLAEIAISFVVFIFSVIIYFGPWALTNGDRTIFNSKGQPCSIYNGMVITLFGFICGDDLVDTAEPNGRRWSLLQGTTTANLAISIILMLLLIWRDGLGFRFRILKFVIFLTMMAIVSTMIQNFRKFEHPIMGEDGVDIVKTNGFTYVIILLIFYLFGTLYNGALMIVEIRAQVFKAAISSV